MGPLIYYVQRELPQYGHRVTTASTVLEAFLLIVQTKLGLIIISEMMPELDSIGIFSMSATRKIPLALISSHKLGD